jgi:hypothetical protein
VCRRLCCVRVCGKILNLEEFFIFDEAAAAAAAAAA